MMKLNWFECDLRCYDSTGMEVDITELPAKDRREIATAIINGNKCGSFSSEVVQEDLLGELNPMYVYKLKAVCDEHRHAVERRETEREERAKLLGINTLEEKEENEKAND